jgi:hypothetical protein
VWISTPAVLAVAESTSAEEFPIPGWHEAVFPEDDLIFLDFIGIGNAINFAFTDFSTHESFAVNYDGNRWRGAFAMWACLRRAIEQGVSVLEGEFLRQVTVHDLSGIFAGESLIPMLHQRAAILREIGGVLCERYGGRFRNVFLKGVPNAFGEDGLVMRLLRDFPSFRDESVQRTTGAVLKFEKRAQLMAMMYHGRAVGSKLLTELTDSDDVGPIADYAVPRALHRSGILSYAPGLEVQIASSRLIEKDSIAEQEIRAQTIRAQIELRNAINRLRTPQINFIQLDYKLWSLGRGINHPHHLTSTTAY